MSIPYLVLWALLSPLLAIPIYLIFVGGPFLILYIPNLLWRLSRWMLFPTTTPTIVIPTHPIIPPPMKPYKPKGKKSKIAGIRKNRAILAIANGSVRYSEPIRH